MGGSDRSELNSAIKIHCASAQVRDKEHLHFPTPSVSQADFAAGFSCPLCLQPVEKNKEKTPVGDAWLSPTSPGHSSLQLMFNLPGSDDPT